ncbi:protein kinase domain-containing protein, partial [Pseudonocardia pini]|uniref:protein kinase domain-containing protein n=1 Tax=Pseudonocardia pini TaxID=2758030 RepID=UPI0024837CE5
MRPVATALDRLHDKGILHGDLTPAAIVLDAAGRGSLRVDPLAGLAADTRDHTIGTLDTGTAGVGAPVYLAPEQLAGPVASHRTDLFAFAAVAFELVTGTPAFTVGSLLEQGDRRVPAASTRRPGIPAGTGAEVEPGVGEAGQQG